MASVKRKSIESQKEDHPLLPPQKQLREDHSNKQYCVSARRVVSRELCPSFFFSYSNSKGLKTRKGISFHSRPLFSLKPSVALTVANLSSAHTSAGKTVVALYAIAMSLKNQQRVVYTSPIKALSNQKFREFKEEFSDVMTTEIWRSMQYKGSETTREVAWIIFDEVHYMRDRERGVVWEESILMAPKNARFVFLSATVPNAKEFADWVAKVHQQPCHIVYTDYRPTPSNTIFFPLEGLYLVVDEKAKFREDSFQKAVNALVPKAEGEKKRENGKWQKGLNVSRLGEESDIFKMVKMIIRRQYDPVILFSFSKRECEFLAMQMAKMDLNQDDEKANIETIFWSAMDMLSDDRQEATSGKLSASSSLCFKYVTPLKTRYWCHHSGLLPILKEVIEILFQEGLIKCLFATETFSIGLNMPAKTVVFYKCP
ncbi:LOW QUALITY PROTEIN: hypothetical protein NC651_012028 [Populus alba x Populus x berolinensis]|nr:LOW QUALITY PROTEIN: hypothetical protein NC651_012028 [Populus alba x Populus x berolinensis]